jgi:hypothetical protein
LTKKKKKDYKLTPKRRERKRLVEKVMREMVRDGYVYEIDRAVQER